ncbi:MAG TPA: MBL fold metallo-hydrolase [Steroidobacteraceae bacterium]|nr:MBL fold metallo-hydrolase [Steroidobacteraceae bacterium]
MSSIPKFACLLGWLQIGLGTMAWPAAAAPSVQRIGPHLYAYISDDDASSNSTFLVRASGILVVDTGLNRVQGGKLLGRIRRISQAPIRYVINTQYDPDHLGGNEIIGPNAVILSTAFTRERSMRLWNRARRTGVGDWSRVAYRAPTLTFAGAGDWPAALRSPVIVYLDGETVDIYAPGPGHTKSDAVVYFPSEKAVATGDLFLKRSCSDMDPGSSLANWVRSLRGILALPVTHYVPGHFEVGRRADVIRFYDYMSTLWTQVRRLYAAGTPIGQVPAKLDMVKFANFRQFPQFNATFGDNARDAYRQLQARR